MVGTQELAVGAVELDRDLVRQVVEVRPKEAVVEVDANFEVLRLIQVVEELELEESPLEGPTLTSLVCIVGCGEVMG